ncbi:DNA (cytosine-5-)-methyltransferase [Roseivirga sp. UBA1976]|uniref:DNA cytosine methyltransferase n=1 Tax=Roseivirga sp. UBA1976 TaxID=1947386 RepID=UPI00257B89CC|nr:DNA (cytosine-5-)-methyltransferase [Roseivirga sp. UBA1976]|tara:strand:- start:3891 stop:4994 length:1104 start_codon:yes stop_codon:yes gene_type:complete
MNPALINQNFNSIAAIDLFCGIGGLTNGLRKAGIPVLAGIDQDKSCKYAYEVNNEAEFIGEDISKISGESLINRYWRDTDLKILVGCAPCQPFSSHSNKIREEEKIQDIKWNLLSEFLRLIRETQPQIVSMENVPNLSKKNVFLDFVNSLKKEGYHVQHQNVYCPDYGIPQKRRRLVLVASKFGAISLIEKTHEPKNYKSTFQAIGGLQKLKHGEKSSEDPLHFTSKLTDLNLRRIQASKPNGTWLDWDEELRLECHKKDSGKTYSSVYGRMTWHEPSPTITTQFYNFGTGRFGHPEQDRALTIREAALLQTFPDNYEFEDPKEPISLKRIATHIGNAVPVDLGYVVGKSIKEHLNKLQNERIRIKY